ncbi:hypothetical protein C5167_014222 [Papaver somniferum]|uniref:Peroxisomal membrane protein PEX14 central plants domain-containing protein n=1 Tax=Papaver somniferum TaxID=3469 RepID=A0A4Y7J6L5_PAPSO|nr:hypothetical protein C5167_014222 [Papaver somniferum]
MKLSVECLIPPPPTTTMPAAIPNQDGQSTSPINLQPQIQARAPQPAVPPPSGLELNVGVPRLKSWIHKVVLEEDGDNSLEKSTLKTNPTEEAATAAKAAAAAALDVAKASQDNFGSS